MVFDYIFVAGLLFALFGLPALVSAFSDKRRPTNAVIMFLLGGGMIYYAYVMNPGAYSLDTIDDLVLRVMGDLLNS